METWVMWAVAAVVVVVPVALGAVFGGRDRADSAGRRIDHGWRAGRDKTLV